MCCTIIIRTTLEIQEENTHYNPAIISKSVFTHFLFILIHVQPCTNLDSFRFFPFYPFVAHPAFYDHTERIPAQQVRPLPAQADLHFTTCQMALSHYTNLHKPVTKYDQDEQRKRPKCRVTVQVTTRASRGIFFIVTIAHP